MLKVIHKALLCSAVFILLMPAMGVSQYNAHSLYKDIIGSDFHFSYISSATAPKVLSNPEFGVFTVKTNPESENLYRYTYSPGITKGNTKAVIEYYRFDEQSQSLVSDYTTIHFKITPSLISCTDDFVSIEMNDAKVSIPVLENDTRTNGPLVLKNIIYSENGSASISDGQISFTPATDFYGDAFIYYSVEDQLGEKASGLVKVKVVDPAIIDKKKQLSYISYGGEAVEIDLPFDGFKTTSALKFGYFKSKFGKQQYVPYGNNNSEESFTLVKNGISRTVTVKVIYKERENSFVNDDVRYTTKGSGIAVDVLENDLIVNGEIINHSSSLTPTGVEGVFSYNPPGYFSGSKTMSYSLSDGNQSETGYVTVHVNDFNPQTKYDYDFLTLGNSPLVINYNIPISDFSFEIVSEPSHGSAFVNDGFSSITFSCDEISGNNLILYTPEFNYTGKDEFTVRYCVEGSCRNVDISVDVVEPSQNDCRCYTGCVWSGDANNDGIVNASDILTLAYAFGETGPESTVDAELPWNGRKSDNWFFNSKTGVNAKFSDSDGNGLIDEADFSAIEENYNLNHALVPPQFMSRRNYPFTLSVVNDTVYAGDLIEFEIGIGNALFPALDVNGISYSLGFPPSFVDSASMDVDYYSNSWFGIDERVVDLTKQIRKGWLESAAARLSTSPASGVGTIAKASFIVEEDVVGGFRVDNDGIVPMIIEARDIQVSTADGEISTLEDTELVVYIDVRERERIYDDSEMKVFPNPASDQFTLHMNGGHEILSYVIYSIDGQQISAAEVKDKSTKITTKDLSQGLYIINAQTSSGPRIEKLEILR